MEIPKAIDAKHAVGQLGRKIIQRALKGDAQGDLPHSGYLLQRHLVEEGIQPRVAVIRLQDGY